MSTGIICTMKLDPFYQAFLRSRFEQTGKDIFAFPKGHDLSLMFQFLLKPTPRDFDCSEWGEWAFRIEVPFMEHKNPQTYNYLSEARTIVMTSRIMRYWKFLAHDIITEARRRGMQKKEIIFMLLEEMEIPITYSDRIEREYSRYLVEERQKKFMCKKKMLKNVKKMSDKRVKMM